MALLCRSVEPDRHTWSAVGRLRILNESSKSNRLICPMSAETGTNLCERAADRRAALCTKKAAKLTPTFSLCVEFTTLSSCETPRTDVTSRRLRFVAPLVHLSAAHLRGYADYGHPAFGAGRGRQHPRSDQHGRCCSKQRDIRCGRRATSTKRKDHARWPSARTS